MSEYMSASELKEKLFKHFRDSGSLDNLRTQIRSQLANEILKVASPEKTSSKVDTNVELLPLQVSNWLVYDHLKRSNFQYSLSTFVSEANLSSPEKLLSIKDVLNIIGIDESSTERRIILDKYADTSGESFLLVFLSSVSSRLNSSTKGKKSRKPNEENTGQSAEKGDRDAANSVENDTTLDAMHPSKVFSEIFGRDHNFSDSKALTSENYSFLHRQLQLEREKHEMEVRNLRQKLLHELDNIHDQERNFKSVLEKERNRIIREQSLLDMEREKLKVRELELQMKTEALDKEIDERAKILAEKSIHSYEHSEFESWDSKVKEQQMWLENEIQKIKSQADESRELKIKLRQLEETYKNLQREHSEMTKKNADLQAQVNSMSDYVIVKEELSWNRRKVSDYEKEIVRLKSEMEAEKRASLDTIKNLQQNLLQSVPKHALHSHFSDFKGHHHESYLPNSDRQKSSDEYRETKELCHAVLQRVQEQKTDIQELHSLIRNIYHLLNQEESSNKSINLPRFLSHERTKHEVKPDVTKNDNVKQHQSSVIAGDKEFDSELSYADKYKNVAFQFLSDAKKRIEALEKESKDLEEKYTTFSKPNPISLPIMRVPLSVHSVNVLGEKGSHLDIGSNIHAYDSSIPLGTSFIKSSSLFPELYGTYVTKPTGTSVFNTDVPHFSELISAPGSLLGGNTATMENAGNVEQVGFSTGNYGMVTDENASLNGQLKTRAFQRTAHSMSSGEAEAPQGVADTTSVSASFSAAHRNSSTTEIPVKIVSAGSKTLNLQASETSQPHTTGQGIDSYNVRSYNNIFTSLGMRKPDENSNSLFGISKNLAVSNKHESPNVTREREFLKPCDNLAIDADSVMMVKKDGGANKVVGLASEKMSSQMQDLSVSSVHTAEQVYSRKTESIRESGTGSAKCLFPEIIETKSESSLSKSGIVRTQNQTHVDIPQTKPVDVDSRDVLANQESNDTQKVLQMQFGKEQSTSNTGKKGQHEVTNSSGHLAKKTEENKAGSHSELGSYTPVKPESSDSYNTVSSVSSSPRKPSNPNPLFLSPFQRQRSFFLAAAASSKQPASVDGLTGEMNKTSKPLSSLTAASSSFSTAVKNSAENINPSETDSKRPQNSSDTIKQNGKTEGSAGNTSTSDTNTSILEKRPENSSTKLSGSKAPESTVISGSAKEILSSVKNNENQAESDGTPPVMQLPRQSSYPDAGNNTQSPENKNLQGPAQEVISGNQTSDVKVGGGAEDSQKNKTKSLEAALFSDVNHGNENSRDGLHSERESSGSEISELHVSAGSETENSRANDDDPFGW